MKMQTWVNGYWKIVGNKKTWVPGHWRTVDVEPWKVFPFLDKKKRKRR